MSTLMAALVKYMPIQIIPKTLTQRRTNRGKERKMATRDNSITRQVMGTMVSVRQTIVWTLWLTPMLRITVSIVNANSPRGAEGQAPIWSAC